MKSLYATLYFSSTAIPGVARAPGTCHRRGCAPSWELNSQRPAAPPSRLCLPGCWHDLAKAATAPGFAPAPAPSRHSEGPQTNSGMGQFPDKERKLLEGGTRPRYAAPLCRSSLPRLPTGRRGGFFAQGFQSHSSRKKLVLQLMHLRSPRLESQGTSSFSTLDGLYTI